MTSNQKKIIEFLNDNIGVFYTICDIQTSCFGRPKARRRGFGNVTAMNSIRGLIDKKIVFRKITNECMLYTLFNKVKV